MPHPLKKYQRDFTHHLQFYLPRSSQPSLFFFTFHKCASSLFSSYVLKNLAGLRHVDYGSYLWPKPNSFKGPLRFPETGFVFGPIRLSSRNQLARDLLVRPTADLDFVQDKRAIFFVRDPRDILVSAYYSFGFTHPLNHIAEKRQAQLERRQAIQALTLDEYVLAYAEQQVAYFDHLQEVAAHCQHKIILRYEDMVEDFDGFVRDLKTVVSLKEKVIQELYRRSRPREGVDDGSHRRSGATRRYLKDLQPETIGRLNEVLGRTLGEFGYEL